MADTPCGCRLAEDAAKMEPEPRKVAEAEAKTFAKLWQCPRKGGPAPSAASAAKLPPECHDTIAAVGRLTGFDCAQTCPRFYAYLPWVQEASAAYNASEKHRLKIAYPRMSSTLYHAMEAVEAGVAARHVYEDAQREAKRKREENKP